MADRGWRREGHSRHAPAAKARHGTSRTSSTASRQRSTPTADIETGHLSTRLCHLGNIAFRLGRKLTFDAASESFRDPEANKLLTREYSTRFEMPSQV